MNLVAAGATVICAASVALVPPARASAPDIIGGETAPATPWVVQLVFRQDDGTYGCTGEQIAAAWVLTARHCVDGTTAMNVYHSRSTTRRGSSARVARLYPAPRGDLALVRLASPYPLRDYPTLRFTYRARSTGTAVIMGFGARAGGRPSSGLNRATVRLGGAATDAYRGRAQHVTGLTGAANHGDSGGPLLVNGTVVGVCSTGDVADPGANVHAGATYAILGQSTAWIRRTAGL